MAVIILITGMMTAVFADETNENGEWNEAGASSGIMISAEENDPGENTPLLESAEETTTGGNAITASFADSFNDEPLNFEPFNINMQEYWLEQLFNEMNTMNLTVQQFRNQFNSMHLTSQMHLQETRNYHSSVTNFQSIVQGTDETLIKLVYWLISLMAFLVALVTIIIFAMQWGK
jgi:hypothetical protein